MQALVLSPLLFLALLVTAIAIVIVRPYGTKKDPPLNKTEGELLLLLLFSLPSFLMYAVLAWHHAGRAQLARDFLPVA